MTIERWFKKGARFKWTAPTAVSPVAMDGAIVASPPTISNMMFDAADFRLVKTVDTAGWIGFTGKTPVPHTWLCYVLGQTAYQPLATDVLTGFMSGCLIVQWVEGGQRYVGHVGTVESAAKNQPPNSTVKTTFSNRLAGLTQAEKFTVKGYSPANAWDFGEIAPVQALFKNGDSKILSLTTATGQFYSILLLRASAEPNVWVSGGCKACNGMGFNALTSALA